MSHNRVNDYENKAEKRGVKDIVKIIDYGSPKNIIPKKAVKKTGADLIACGATGLNAVERFIIGSVSENIVRHAPCDVLVVRTENLPDDFEPVVATEEYINENRK